MAASVAEGGCMCSAIRYRISGQPTNSMVCHCRSCRRAAGAPVVAWVTFPADRFQLLRGHPSQFKSSKLVCRTFCSACGTPLTYQRDDAPGSIDVTTCSLDDPDSFPPTHHSWLSHDVAWVRFGDGLPTFQEWRPESGA